MDQAGGIPLLLPEEGNGPFVEICGVFFNKRWWAKCRIRVNLSEFRFFALLCDITQRRFITAVSAQRIDPIFIGQAVQEEIVVQSTA